MLDFKVLDNQITQLIEDAKLTRTSNDFFLLSNKLKEVSLMSAFNIARNWREITKNFLFSVIASLGKFSEKINKEQDPKKDVLVALQKGFSIINDDLNNAHPVFKDKASQGHLGIHYKWWEESILNPLAQLTSFQEWYKVPLSPKTEALVKEMNRLNPHVFGAVIQMRVVESIAFDIASSFNKLFSVVKVGGVGVFTNDKLAWIRTHIKAEKFHQKQVSDEESGILCLASSAKEQKEILEMTKHYVSFWSGVLSEFKSFLINLP